MEKNRSFGLLLVGIGAMLLLSQLNILKGNSVLFIIGLGFFAAYILSKGSGKEGNVGFLIPGCIVTAIGAFDTLSRVVFKNMPGGFFFLFIGGAFAAVYLVHTRHVKEKGNRNWPLYPATALIGFGTFVTLMESVDRAPFLNWVFPIGLILVGLFLAKGQARKTH